MIELNGVANIAALLEIAKMDDKVDQTLYDQIHDQLDVLERYMLAVERANRKGLDAPKWHEVRDNRTKFPTNNGG